MRKPSKARIKRWADRMIGSDAMERMEKLTAASIRASKGYNAYPSSHYLYGSGLEAGETEAHGLLQEKWQQTDRDLRNYGDFLISYGDYLLSLDPVTHG